MRQFAITLAAVILAAPAAKAGNHGTTAVIESGACVTLELPHVDRVMTTNVCSGKVINSVLPNGRVLFSFTSKRGAPPIAVSFAGNGSQQFTPSDNVAMQPIDAVDFNVGFGSNHLKAIGRCTYDNPYEVAGKAYIRCDARTAQGKFTASLEDGKVDALSRPACGSPEYTPCLFKAPTPPLPVAKSDTDSDWYMLATLGGCEPGDPRVVLVLGSASGVTLRAEDVKVGGRIVATTIFASDGSSTRFYRGKARCEAAIRRETRDLDRYK